MEYRQERVTTLHDYSGARPEVPLDSTTIVIPMTETDYRRISTERVFRTLEAVEPGQVLVALRATRQTVAEIVSWIESFDVRSTVLWCNAPAIQPLLASHELDGPVGKGRDVWLALGIARNSDYIVVHDVDAANYDERTVKRLLFPLTRDHAFSKAYYARIEENRLYGRLFRLLVVPLLDALDEAYHAPILSYLRSFRYTLAGEFAMTGELAESIRAPRGWGLEIGTLGDAFHTAGFDGSAQVDLGIHQHDHRPVDGPGGLGDMASEVAETLFMVIEEFGIEPEYERLPERYRTWGKRRIDQYETDAAFNGFDYDKDQEHRQVNVYADAINPPGTDDRLPPWKEIELDSDRLLARSSESLDEVQTRLT